MYNVAWEGVRGAVYCVGYFNDDSWNVGVRARKEKPFLYWLCKKPRRERANSASGLGRKMSHGGITSIIHLHHPLSTYVHSTYATYKGTICLTSLRSETWSKRLRVSDYISASSMDRVIDSSNTLVKIALPHIFLRFFENGFFLSAFALPCSLKVVSLPFFSAEKSAGHNEVASFFRLFPQNKSVTWSDLSEENFHAKRDEKRRQGGGGNVKPNEEGRPLKNSLGPFGPPALFRHRMM